MDITYIVVFGILLFGAILTALVSHAWKTWVQPWIEEHQLQEEAAIVVNAVEALLGRYQGQAKWEMALDKMVERGWNIDVPAVIDALQAAWQLLDIKQIQAGVKQPEALGTGESTE